MRRSGAPNGNGNNDTLYMLVYSLHNLLRLLLEQPRSKEYVPDAQAIRGLFAFGIVTVL
jgi:hypothetical protein